MQGFISYTTASACWRLIPPMSTSAMRDNCSLVDAERSQVGATPAVPGSPGHPRQLRPYPPSCCKRQ